ncbi:MAG: SCO family protein [Planctomycetales bacterium]
MNRSRLWIRLSVWLGTGVIILGFYAWKRLQRATAPPSATAHTTPLASNAVYDANPLPLKPFALTDSAGKPFRSEDLLGEVWAASFFFSTCNGPCMSVNRSIERLQKDIDSEVRFVSVTVNPKIDTADKLREYASAFEFDPGRWIFLTGRTDQVQRVAMHSFNVPASGANDENDGEITHFGKLILVDRQGRIRGYHNPTDPAEAEILKRKIKKLLKEPAPETP